jgi:hypothetical protein
MRVISENEIKITGGWNPKYEQHMVPRPLLQEEPLLCKFCLKSRFIYPYDGFLTKEGSYCG